MPGSDFYIWQARTHTVRIALDLIERITAVLQDARNARDAECGGILLGRVREPSSIELCGFEPIRSEHHRGTIFGLGLREQQRVARRVGSLARSKSLHPVGFFRTHLRPGLYLDQDDFGLMQDAFGDPSDIALLIRPVEPGPPNAGIFVWEDGDIDRRQAAQLFPFDSDTLRAEGPIEAAPAQPVSKRRKTGVRVPSIPKPVLGWSVVAVAGLVLVVGGLRTGHRAVGGNHVSGTTRPLNLQMRKKGDAITIDWDRKATSLQAASSAVLTIRDGAEEQKLTLNRGDLEHGNVQFWPRSDDVSVRMDVGRSIVERAPAVEAPRTAGIAASTTEPVPERPAPVPKALPYVETTETTPVVVARYSDETPELPRASPSALKPAAVLSPPPAPMVRPEREERATLDVPSSPLPAMPGPPSRDTPPPEAAKIVRRTPSRPAGVAVSVRVEHRNSGEVRKVVSHVPLLGRSFHGESRDNFSPARPVRPLEPRVPESLARYVVGDVDVDVKLSLDKHGSVKNAEILNGVGSELASLAANSATSAMWEPAYDGDRPVASDVVVHYRFKSGD